VDEVLAVGDAEFQKKCLDKMDDVRQTGRTILFVSHNMQAITRLCTRCLLLEKGQLRMDGHPEQVSGAYLGSGTGTNAAQEWDPAEAPGDHVVRARAVRVRNEAGEVTETFDIRETIRVEIEYDVLESGHIFHPHFSIRNESGDMLFVAQDVDPEWRKRARPAGRYISTGWIPGNLLAEGAMSIYATLMTLKPEVIRADMLHAVVFQVVDCLTADDTARGDYPRPIPGLLRPLLRWTTEYKPPDEQVDDQASDVDEGPSSRTLLVPRESGRHGIRVSEISFEGKRSQIADPSLLNRAFNHLSAMTESIHLADLQQGLVGGGKLNNLSRIGNG
jgi:lipopolysaccharide transport system ATP-binding protein